MLHFLFFVPQRRPGTTRGLVVPLLLLVLRPLVPRPQLDAASQPASPAAPNTVRVMDRLLLSPPPRYFPHASLSKNLHSLAAAVIFLPTNFSPSSAVVSRDLNKRWSRLLATTLRSITCRCVYCITISQVQLQVFEFVSSSSRSTIAVYLNLSSDIFYII